MPWKTRAVPSGNPEIVACPTRQSYYFMYDVAVFSDQQNVYLFVEHDDPGVHALVFSGGTFKFGPPNDEALSGHPLAKFGLTHYGFFEVRNSPWIDEVRSMNRVHPRHDDTYFGSLRHFIATFKDGTFEVLCRDFDEVRLSQSDVQNRAIAAIPGMGRTTG